MASRRGSSFKRVCVASCLARRRASFLHSTTRPLTPAALAASYCCARRTWQGRMYGSVGVALQLSVLDGGGLFTAPSARVAV